MCIISLDLEVTPLKQVVNGVRNIKIRDAMSTLGMLYQRFNIQWGMQYSYPYIFGFWFFFRKCHKISEKSQWQCILATQKYDLFCHFWIFEKNWNLPLYILLNTKYLFWLKLSIFFGEILDIMDPKHTKIATWPDIRLLFFGTHYQSLFYFVAQESQKQESHRQASSATYTAPLTDLTSLFTLLLSPEKRSFHPAWPFPKFQNCK